LKFRCNVILVEAGRGRNAASGIWHPASCRCLFNW